MNDKPHYEFEWPHTDEHLIAIGKVIVESASIEQVLQLAIWQILGTPEETGSQITGDMQLAGRASLFESIAKATFTKEMDKNELAEIMGDIRAANSKRNDIAHGLYWFGIKKSEIWLHRYRKETKGGHKGQYRLWKKKITPKYVESIAADLAAAHERLAKFLGSHGVEPPPPPRIPARPY